MTHLSARTVNNQVHQAFHAPPRGYRPKLRVKGLPLRKVHCPDCGAEVGSPCLTGSGAENTRGHASRRRLAARTQWEVPDTELPREEADDGRE